MVSANTLRLARKPLPTADHRAKISIRSRRIAEA